MNKIVINNSSRELTKVEQYLMTAQPDIQVLKNVPDDTIIPVKLFCDYTEIRNEPDKDGNTEVNLLAIMTENNEVYNCQSGTFKQEFAKIADIAGGNNFSIIKKSGQSKNGRDFIYCTLDINSLT